MLQQAREVLRLMKEFGFENVLDTLKGSTSITEYVSYAVLMEYYFFPSEYAAKLFEQVMCVYPQVVNLEMLNMKYYSDSKVVIELHLTALIEKTIKEKRMVSDNDLERVVEVVTKRFFLV